MTTDDHQKLTLDELANRNIAWIRRVLPEDYWRDAEVAAPWLADDPADRRLLPVADAFEVSRRIIMGLSGEQSS